MTKQEARLQALAEMTLKAESEFKVKVKECLLAIANAQKNLSYEQKRLAEMTYVPPTLPEIEE